MSEERLRAPFELPELPFATEGIPGVGGRIRVAPEDFRVEEIPAYLPCGEGEHLFVSIEKRGVTTDGVARALARAAEVPLQEIGYAGQKDREAVTRQYVSMPARGASALERFEMAGVRVLNAKRHGNRLRTGHLLGNRFVIVLRDVSEDALERARAIALRLRLDGLPNAFGPQRFGRDGETARRGIALLARGKKGPGGRDRYQRKLFVSAAQALLYNRYLVRRAADGSMNRMMPGDVARRTDSGGLFVVDDVEEAQRRFDAREIVHAGPIFGRKTFRAAGEAARREEQILREADLTREAFAPFGKLALGTRRANLVFLDGLDGLDVAPHEHGLELRFALPPGSYATVLLREVTKTELA